MYTERLWPPLGWWLVGALLAGAVGLVFLVLGPLVALVGFVVAAAGIVAGLVSYAAAVAVDAAGLTAGRALLPWEAIGRVRALDPVEAGTLRGRGADARAFLLLRAYAPAAVVVEVCDLDDPTPYWYVSTRHPDRLTAALRGRPAGDRDR